MIERRQSIRVECELLSFYRDLDSKNPAHNEEMLVKNISRGGVKIRVNRFVPIQDKLYLSILLPNHHTIEAQVSPAWVVEIPSVGQYEIGARFLDIHPDDEEAIRGFQYQVLLEKMPFRPNVVKDLLDRSSQNRNARD